MKVSELIDKLSQFDISKDVQVSDPSEVALVYEVADVVDGDVVAIAIDLAS